MSENIKKYILNSIFIVSLTVLIIVGVIARINYLVHSENFYYDEFAILKNIVERPITGYFSTLTNNQICPPFFLIAGKIVYKLFGFNQIALKSITCSASILSFFAFIYLCKKFFQQKTAIILSVFLFALNPQLLIFSGIFKPYATDCLFAVLFIIFLLHYKNFEDKLTPRQYLILGLIGGFCCFCSYPMAFLISSFTCFFVVKNFIKNKKINLKKLLYFLTPITFVLVYLLFAIFISAKNNPEQISYWYTIYKFTTFNLFNEKASFFNWFFYWQTDKNLILYIIVVLSYFLTFKKNKFHFVILFLPFLMGEILGIFRFYPFGGARINMYLMPFLILLMAKPIDYINFKSKKLLNINLFLTIIYLIFLNNFHLFYFNIFPKEYNVSSWKELSDIIVQSDITKDDYIILTGEQIFSFLEHLKYIKNNNINPQNTIYSYKCITQEQNIEKGKNIFLYTKSKDIENTNDYQENSSEQEQNDLEKWLNTNCEQLYIVSDGKYELRKYKKK